MGHICKIIYNLKRLDAPKCCYFISFFFLQFNYFFFFKSVSNGINADIQYFDIDLLTSYCIYYLSGWWIAKCIFMWNEIICTISWNPFAFLILFFVYIHTYVFIFFSILTSKYISAIIITTTITTAATEEPILLSSGDLCVKCYSKWIFNL